MKKPKYNIPSIAESEVKTNEEWQKTRKEIYDRRGLTIKEKITTGKKRPFVL